MAFRATGAGLLRVPARPHVLRSPDLGALDDPGRGIGVLREDAELVEAVTVANYDLASAWVDERPDRRVKPAKLRRMAQAVVAYAARMGGRPTPLGVFAGVAGVAFDDDAVAVQPRLRKHTRPDQEWLAGVVEALLRDIDVVAVTRVRAADVTWRGDRVVARRRLVASANGDGGDQEVSARATPAVRALLQVAARWRPVPDVLGWLGNRYGLDRDHGLAIVRDMIASGLLQCDLLPSVDYVDPLAELTIRMGDCGRADVAADLRRIAELMSAYDTMPLGSGVSAWTSLRERMQQVPGSRGKHLARVDTTVADTVSLPEHVAAEAVDAAAVLQRLFSHTSTATEVVRGWFLATHGTDRLVSLRELVDDHASGPLAGLLDVPDAVCADTPPWRQEFLAQLLAHGDRTVWVEPDSLPALHLNAAVPPVSMDVFANLVAFDHDALSRGEFVLVEPRVGPGPAGASFTRVADLLAADVVGSVGATVAGLRPRMDAAVYAEVVYEPTHVRARNVLALSGWTPYRIVVDADHAESPGDLSVDDLLVGGTPDRMYVVSRTLGVPVVPVSHSRVSASMAPPVVRLLLAIGADDAGEVHGWSWGPFADLPFLPQVRYGTRTVLAPARWAIPPQLRDQAQSGSPEQWLDCLDRWRQQARVPGHIVVGVADRRTPLDLDHPWHGLLLRREITTRDVRHVSEHIGGNGWFANNGEQHVTELVVPLVSTNEVTTPRPPRSKRVVAADGPRVHQPGGQYLSLELDVPTRSQNTVLKQLVAMLADEMSEHRWFFLRYHRVTDQLRRAHLRLRFRGEPGTLARHVLPAWHDAAAELAERGLVGQWRVMPFAPEVERYGGPETYDLAEAVFHADGLAVVHTLATEQPGLIGTPVMAVSAADLMLAMDPRQEHGGWLSSLHGQPDPDFRPEVRALTGTDQLPNALGPHVAAAWSRRRELAEQLGERVRAHAERTWSPPARIFESITHLHCIRMAGIAPDLEHNALVLARDAIAALTYTDR